MRLEILVTDTETVLSCIDDLTVRSVQYCTVRWLNEHCARALVQLGSFRHLLSRATRTLPVLCLPNRYDWENLQIACFAVSSDGMYSAKYRRLDKGAEDGKPEESEWKDATRMLDANARIEWRQSNSRSK